MLLKKALVKNPQSYGTFIYIPDAGSGVRSAKMPMWIPRVLIIMVVCLILLCIAGTTAAFTLKVRYESSKAELQKLMAINQTQKEQIETLQDDANGIKMQLEENKKALEEIKNAVGVGIQQKASDDATQNKETTSALKSSLAPIPYGKTQYSDMTGHLDNLKVSFVYLSKETFNLKQEIEKSKHTVISAKANLDYLAAKPSISPINAAITCGFGHRADPFTSRGSEFHPGVDFGAPVGTDVHAAGNGIVIFAGWHAGYGKMVIISHGYGFQTAYAHNSKLLVKQGDKVKKGQVISKVGNTGRSTGAHLHYEIQLNGRKVNPEDYF